MRNPLDGPECPECGAAVEITGCRMEGEANCVECNWRDSWDNIPNG